jgi:ADP-heptose:LPS heptosyltransferase
VRTSPVAHPGSGSGRTEPRPTLLVLRALGLGDLLTALPALRALREAFLDHRLVLAMPRALEPIARLSGAVDEVADAAPLGSLPPSLGQPALAANLHGRGPESHRILLRLGPRRLVSFAHPRIPATAGSPSWRPNEHEVHRWCRLLRESGIPADPTRLELRLPGDTRRSSTAGATIIHPGAASPARRWPLERWAIVARSEIERGRRVLVTGTPGEASGARTLAEMAGLDRGDVLAGRTTLLGLIAAVSSADIVASGDTGVAHLATALGTPSVILFGPTPPSLWGPPPDRPIHRVIWKGGQGDPHAGRPDPGLLAIRPGEVLDAMEHVRHLASGSVPAVAGQATGGHGR